jgi:hypothetical protein
VDSYLMPWCRTTSQVHGQVQRPEHLDKVYYDALYDNGFTVPGQARRFILSTEYKF